MVLAVMFTILYIARFIYLSSIDFNSGETKIVPKDSIFSIIRIIILVLPVLFSGPFLQKNYIRFSLRRFYRALLNNFLHVLTILRVCTRFRIILFSKSRNMWGQFRL